MAYKGNYNNSLLYSIYKSVHGPDEAVEARSKYSEGTKTLYAVGKKVNTTKKHEPPHFQVPVKSYAKIIDGTYRCAVVKSATVIPGNDIYIEEENNWIPTGRRTIKVVRSVQTCLDVGGIKDGYMLIEWQ